MDQYEAQKLDDQKRLTRRKDQALDTYDFFTRSLEGDLEPATTLPIVAALLTIAASLLSAARD
jgi:hypothetical protein